MMYDDGDDWMELHGGDPGDDLYLMCTHPVGEKRICQAQTQRSCCDDRCREGLCEEHEAMCEQCQREFHLKCLVPVDDTLVCRYCVEAVLEELAKQGITPTVGVAA